MRGTFVAAAVVLAFAAGWLLRGCSGDRATTNDAPRAPAIVVVKPTPAPSPRRETSASRADETSSVARDNASGAKSDARSESPAEKTSSPPKPGDAAAAPAEKPPITSVSGVVVDRLTGAPVAGVMIHLCVSREDGEFGGWTGAGSDVEGKFKAELPSDWISSKNRFEIVAGKDGFRPTRIPITTDTARVELDKLDRAPRPGRVVGTARDADGKPIPGRLFVGMGDDLDLHSFGVWTNADANGRFAIDGIAPGHWTVSLAESRKSFEVNVSEDGEASVELVGEFEEATGAFAAGELTDGAFAREKKRLEMLMYSGAGPDSPAGSSASYAKQQLEYQWLRRAPGRHVVVTGLPATAGAFVRLDRRGGACCEWRAAVVDGAAKFTSIPLDRWRATLVRPGVEDVSSDDVDVEAGEGPLAIELKAAK